MTETERSQTYLIRIVTGGDWEKICRAQHITALKHKSVQSNALKHVHNFGAKFGTRVIF